MNVGVGMWRGVSWLSWMVACCFASRGMAQTAPEVFLDHVSSQLVVDAPEETTFSVLGLEDRGEEVLNLEGNGLQKTIFGLPPHSAGQIAVITDDGELLPFRVRPSELGIRFHARADHSYALESSADLLEWFPERVIHGISGEVRETVTVPAEAAQYFRVSGALSGEGKEIGGVSGTLYQSVDDRRLRVSFGGNESPGWIPVLEAEVSVDGGAFQTLGLQEGAFELTGLGLGCRSLQFRVGDAFLEEESFLLPNELTPLGERSVDRDEAFEIVKTEVYPFLELASEPLVLGLPQPLPQGAVLSFSDAETEEALGVEWDVVVENDSWRISGDGVFLHRTPVELAHCLLNNLRLTQA